MVTINKQAAKQIAACLLLLVLKKGLSQDDSELAKINRELDNPLAKRWSLVFQENL